MTHRTANWYFALVLAVSGLVAEEAVAQEKVTYQDHVLPLIEANCSKCHNADKKKADLDLTSFAAVLKGSGSGPVVISGNADGSKLWRAVSHAEEPFMPPNRPKLPDKELEVFKKWIAGGLLEKQGAQAIAAAKSGMDLELKPGAVGKPEGPPPMPVELPIEPVVHTSRGNAITALAASPWAPLAAVGGQKQILLYNSDTLSLLGILPFLEGQPAHVRFSQNGKLLLASGGLAAKSGRVVLWDITSGELLLTLGSDEYDTFLSADIRPDQSQIAAGGPSRLVKVYSVKTGQLQHKIKKHTDWVTALGFSPDGQMLASGDRNGSISIWDPDSAQELFTFSGHKSAITSLSWRPDSKLLASASEDGTAKLWEFKEGKQVKSWNANDGGSLCITYAADGQLVTCGRDNTIKLWDAGGGNPRKCEPAGNLPLRAVFTHDMKRIIASDFEGKIGVWNTADQKRAGDLDANPLPLAAQIAAAQSRISELQAGVEAAAKEIAAAEAEVAKANATLEAAKKSQDAANTEQSAKQAEVEALSKQVTNAPADLPARLAAASSAWGEARAKASSAHAALESRTKEVEAATAKLAKAKAANPAPALDVAKMTVVRLQAMQGLSEAYQLRQSIAAKKREHDRLATALETNRKALQKAQQDIEAAKAAITNAETEIKKTQPEISRDEPVVNQLAGELKEAQSRLDALLNQYRAAATNQATPPGQAGA